MKTPGKYYWNIDRIMWLIIGTVVTVSVISKDKLEIHLRSDAVIEQNMIE